MASTLCVSLYIITFDDGSMIDVVFFLWADDVRPCGCSPREVDLDVLGSNDLWQVLERV